MKKISNAGKRTISNSNLPNMSETIKDWFQPIVFGLVSTEIVNYRAVNAISYINTLGVVQPAGNEEIELQDEGVRNWEWLEVHCLPNIQVKINEYIYYKNRKYKVKKRQDFEKYGYMRYVIMEAYDDNNK